ncbi:hypothetical protein EX86_14950, partial [Staphylococcus aureus]
NILFLFIFVLTVFVFNPLIVKFIIWLINITRKFMKLDCISLLDKSFEKSGASEKLKSTLSEKAKKKD